MDPVRTGGSRSLGDGVTARVGKREKISEMMSAEEVSAGSDAIAQRVCLCDCG